MVPHWEMTPDFHYRVRKAVKPLPKWVTWQGKKTVRHPSDHPRAERVLLFESDLPTMDDLVFRDPKTFSAGELHKHVNEWDKILPDTEMGNKVRDWITNYVDVPGFFQRDESDKVVVPPPKLMKNSPKCKDHVTFVCNSIVDRVATGAVSLWGVVGRVPPPYLVSPLTVEPTKPRLCQNLIYLNSFCVDTPFSLDSLSDVPRMVEEGGYMTKLDDKSGYDHILITERSRPLMGFQWGGLWFINNTIPFGWKNSAFVYHNTNLQVASYMRGWGVPNLIYIDDRLLEQFRGRKIQIITGLQRAELAAYAACEILVRLGYYIGLSKSVLVPSQMLIFLGVLIDTLRRAFLLTDKRRFKFAALRDSILRGEKTDILSIQKLMGQCISFMPVVPCAKLYTSSMARAISVASRAATFDIVMDPALREEVEYWRFLDTWTDFLPWFKEYHGVVTLTTDASSFAWGAVVHMGARTWETHDLWNASEFLWDISVKEARALVNCLASFAEEFAGNRLDAWTDNKVFIAAWEKQAARSVHLEAALKDLAAMLWTYNLSLKLTYVPSKENESDAASRKLLRSDCRLSAEAWSRVQQVFGGATGHTLDLMSLDSNAMLGKDGLPLKHFTPYPTPKTSGINVFAQRIDRTENCYVFPPYSMISPVVGFVREQRLTCSLVLPGFDTIPVWQPVVHDVAKNHFLLGARGDKSVLEYPTKQGYKPDTQGLKFPLFVYRFTFE